MSNLDARIIKNDSTVAALAPPEHKILGIELLRFLSSVAVLVFHYQHFKFVGSAPTDFIVSQQPFYSLLSLFYRDGFYGVQVFWCISGFIFFWKYGNEIAAARISGYVFFILRLSRLYPLHFITLIFMALMQYLYFSRQGAFFIYEHNDPYHFFLQLFLASNWGMQVGDSYNGPIWSISIEVLVYAIFFLSLRYLFNNVIFLAGVVLTAAAIQLLKISEHPVFVCIMFFYLGCLTAVMYRWAGHGGMKKKLVTAGCLAALVGLVAVEFFFEMKAKFFLVFFTPALIFLCVTCVPDSRVANRLLVPAGNMTYASYLLHVPIQISVVSLFLCFNVQLPFYSATFFLLYLLGTLALSHWTFEYFEMPAQKFLRRMFMKKK